MASTSDVQRVRSMLGAARGIVERFQGFDFDFAEDADVLDFYAGDIRKDAETLRGWAAEVERAATEVLEAEYAKRRAESPQGAERAEILREFATAEAFQTLIQGLSGWDAVHHGMPADPPFGAMTKGVDLDQAGSLGLAQWSSLWPNDVLVWTADEVAESSLATRQAHELAATMLTALAGAGDWLTAAAAVETKIARANDA